MTLEDMEQTKSISGNNQPHDEKVPLAVGTNMRFIVEKAKQGRASCKYTKCKEKCEKGEIRVGKVGPNPFSEGAEITQWFHPKCVFTQMGSSARAAKLESLDDLQGYEELEQTDQDTIQSLFNQMENGELKVGKSPKGKSEGKAKAKGSKKKGDEDSDSDEGPSINRKKEVKESPQRRGKEADDDQKKKRKAHLKKQKQEDEDGSTSSSDESPPKKTKGDKVPSSKKNMKEKSSKNKK